MTRAELHAEGIADYLVKPVKQSRLLDSLVDVMGPVVSERILARPGPAPALPAGAGFLRAKVRILLAEDNVVNQKVAQAQLKKLGLTADAVANGLEVLQALEGIPYELVLMDCQMPEMDGYEATQLIRQREHDAANSPGARRRVYIIAMTANAMEGDRERCLAVGMDDYMSKPVREADLRDALERWQKAQEG